MKEISNIILLILVAGVVTAQSSIDSLEIKLASSKADTNRILLLSELSIKYLQSDSKMAMKYANEGLELSRKLHFKKGEADCLRRSGIVLFQQGNYPEALDIFQQALKISEDIDYLFGIGAGLGHIGNVYREQGDYVNAMVYYSRHLEIARATKNKFEEANALEHLGEIYIRKGQLDSASTVLGNSYDLARQLQDQRLLGITLNDLAERETKKGNNDHAMLLYREGIIYATATNSLNLLNDIYLGIAGLYRRSGNNDSCIFYALEGLETGRKNNYSKGVLAACRLLAEAYEPVNERQAFAYQKMAIKINDSLFNSARAAQVQNLFFLEEQRKQAIEIANTNYKNRLKLYLLLAGVFVFLLLAIILYRNNQTKQKANNLLQIQKREIQIQRSNAEKALEELQATQAQLIQSEKMASLGELTAGIAHEIQNPLNFINNFSEVNKELLGEMNEEIEKGNLEEVKAISKDVIDNEEKINHHGKRADAIVKGMLQHSRTSSGQKELTDINALCDEYLRLSYYGLRAKDKNFNAEIKTDFDNSIGKINVVPQDIGRVLLNLINNAFYAVNEKQKQNIPRYEPAVTVSTCSIQPPLGPARAGTDGGRRIQIKVADNGGGIPQKILDKIFQPFFTTKPTGQGTGLGLSLAYDIIKAHGGEIKVETIEGEGSEFIIQLPATSNVP